MESKGLKLSLQFHVAATSLCKIDGLVSWNGVESNSGVVTLEQCVCEGTLIMLIRITYWSGMDWGEN